MISVNGMFLVTNLHQERPFMAMLITLWRHLPHKKCSFPHLVGEERGSYPRVIALSLWLAQRHSRNLVSTNQPSILKWARGSGKKIETRKNDLQMVVSILSLSLALQPHAHLRLLSSCAHCRTSTSLIVHLYAKLAPFLGGHPLSHSGSETVRHMALFLHGARG